MATTIRVVYNKKNYMILKVYDPYGRVVTVLNDGFWTAGNHSIKFKMSDLPSGINFHNNGEIR